MLKNFALKLNKIPNIKIYRQHGTNLKRSESLEIGNVVYQTDSWTNITPKILSYIGLDKHLQKNHPLSILRQRIVNYFYKSYLTSRGNPLFSVYDKLRPVVSVEQNFDNLLIPKDHPSRQKSDCYYINKHYLLRAHTTAHQVDLIRCGLDNFLVVGEVYRRDEIDSTHYPVFHQVDAVRLMNKNKIFANEPDLEIFETSFKTSTNSWAFSDAKCMDQVKQPCHTMEAVKLTEHEMKTVLIGLAKDLFGEGIEYKWVETYFPFTQPSWELEILFGDKWLEVLGCGIIRNEILQMAGVQNSIGYAFGLGLERLAMVLFHIPDIRLFWSMDNGFLNQFDESNLYNITKYKPISIYPQCSNDLSFWIPENTQIDDFIVNDFYEIARNIGGDIIEQISLIDKFTHPKTKRSSFCFRITYRHMERTLTQAEVNDIHMKIADACKEQLNITIR